MKPETKKQQKLIAAALLARARAVAPYSGFPVGAALLTARGRIVTGANVESASYGLTCCAERIALFKALTEGEHRFAAIAVVARAPRGPMPCGACRQLLAEYAPRLVVWVADSDQPTRVRSFRLAALLPNPFLSARHPAPTQPPRIPVGSAPTPRPSRPSRRSSSSRPSRPFSHEV